MQAMRQNERWLALALAAGLAPAVWAQPRVQSQSQAAAQAAAETANSAQAMTAGRNAAANIQSGTKISAALQSAVDARTARPGDKVVARVTKNVKQHGRVVVHKGDRLIGHVTQVRPSARGSAGSSIGVAFDQMVSGGHTTQLNTVLSSVFAAQGSGGLEVPSMPAPMAVPMGGGGGGRAGGGLLGGVGSTVGGVGSTVGGLGATAGAATQGTLGAGGAAGLGTPIGAIQLSSQGGAQTSAGADSILSTRRGNLRLNSGTELQFRVAAQGQAQAGNQTR